MAATTGTAVLDFGATPTDEGVITVTGQAGILATSQVEAWVQEATTADNNAEAHKGLGYFSKVVCGNIVAGTGFDINVFMLVGYAYGTFKVQWVWS